MAKRSDFAQKLLDDLRMRKENMTPSHSSKSSKPMAGDSYSHSKQAYRGSREMKTGRTDSTSTGSVSFREGSKDIVPIGRGRSSSQKFGDLSMALTLALENGGKITRTDSSNNSLMLGFLNQIGRRSGKMSKVEGSHRSFPSLSHLHINEIAKGAEKLNQILRACSSGLKFDGYSIEIGKELLKGAIDLEESLRMLVNIQEASDYRVAPKNKARITLLDDEEDDYENTVKTAENNKQLGRPRFSFDKPSRNSRHIPETSGIELKQMLMALTYQSETANFRNNGRNLSTSNSTSRRISEQKNHSSSIKAQPEKARIPNVIAKLMGLEELPENDDPKHITKIKESTRKEKSEQKVIKKTGNGSTRQESKTKDAENLVAPIRKHKETQLNQIQVTRDSHDGTIHGRKPPQKDGERTNLMRSSNKATDKHRYNTDQSTQNIGSQRGIRGKERKLDSAKFKEQKDKERGEAKEPITKHQLQKLVSNTEKLNQNFEVEDMKHHAEMGDQQSGKRHIQVIRQIGSEHTNLPKPVQDNLYLPRKKPSYRSQETSSDGRSTDISRGMEYTGLPDTRHQEDLKMSAQDSTNKSSIENPSPRNLQCDVTKEKDRSSDSKYMEEKAIHKVRVTKLQKAETSRKIDELATRKTLKHQNPVLQEVKQRTKHNKLSRSNECQNLNGHLPTGISDQQGHIINQQLKSHNNGYNPLNQICGGSTKESCSKRQKRYEPVLETPEPLTESENTLMQILVKSQLFINTAEALFQLDIPLGVSSSIDCHSEANKLILDCGYEVMKRKGKRKELGCHPFMKIYITSLKVRSLDDLIKQLHKDLEKLKFYGRNDKIECVVEDYLPKMLELDVYDKEPDVNCMWDFGWNKMMFMSLEKEDVIKDIEKHLLNGLLDELTKDLLVF